MQEVQTNPTKNPTSKKVYIISVLSIVALITALFLVLFLLPKIYFFIRTNVFRPTFNSYAILDKYNFPAEIGQPEDKTCSELESFSDLKKAVQNPTKVCKLHLEGGPISQDLSPVIKFISLKELEFYWDDSQPFPAEVLSLKSLQKLAISIKGSNSPTKLPDFDSLTNLQSLSIHLNEKSNLVLPKNIGNLEALNISGNNGTVTSPREGNWENLKYFRIPHSYSEPNLQLDNLDNLLRNLDSLVYLEITLEDKLPDNILLLNNLQVLKLNNRLTTFPIEITKLNNLKYLDLEGGNFTEVPAEIGLLTNLEVLKVSSSKVERISDEINELKDLKILDVAGIPLVSKWEGIQHLNELLPNTRIETAHINLGG